MNHDRELNLTEIINEAETSPTDPRTYRAEKMMQNVTVMIMRCPEDGAYETFISRQPNTIETYPDELMEVDE